MTDLSNVCLLDPDGNSVRLGDLIDRPTVIDVVRYYGCAPCRAFLTDLSHREADLDALGAGALGIGPRAAYQARALRERIGFPLLLDPDHLVSKAVGVGRQSLLRFLFDVRGWWRWLKSLRSARQGVITGGWWEVPAVIVIDSRCRVVWAHRGRYIGDYPPMDQVLDVVRGMPEV